MTNEQAQLFVSMMQAGLASGLESVEECVMNYERWLYQLYIPKDAVVKEHEMREMLLVFYKGTAGSSEEEEELNNLSWNELVRKMESAIAWRRKRFLEGPRA